MTTPFVGLSLFIYLFIGLVKKLEDFFIKTKRLSGDILAIFIVLIVAAAVGVSALTIIKSSLERKTNIGLISETLENQEAVAQADQLSSNPSQAAQLFYSLPISDLAGQELNNLGSPAGR